MEAKKRDDGFKRALADVRSLLADAESEDPSSDWIQMMTASRERSC